MLEDEASDRAVNGVPVEHYGSNGELRKVTQNRSARLLEFLMRARDPERFGDRHRVQHTGGQTHEVALQFEREEAKGGLDTLAAAESLRPRRTRSRSSPDEA